MRRLAAAGAWLAGSAVGLAAYAAHAVEGAQQERLQTAAVFAFGHGLALAALAPRAVSRGIRIALAVMLVGVLLFSGSLVAEMLSGLRPRLAPFGGSLLIAGWLLRGVGMWRRGE